jgi:hypothetical protein
MDQKFANLQKFVDSQLPHSPVNFMLAHMDLHDFLALILHMKHKYGDLTPKKATQMILDKLSLNPAHLSPEVLQKMELYCEYFLAAVGG